MTSSTVDTAGTGAAPRKDGSEHDARSRRPALSDVAQRLTLPLVWAVVIVVFSVLEPAFPTSQNFASIFSSQAVIVVLTLGLIIPLTAGDYDLSIAATLTLAAMTLALLNVNHGWPLGLAMAAAIGVGLVIGLVNGALVIGFGIDSFVVTLGTGTIIQGLVIWISSATTISGVSPELTQSVVVDRLFSIPLEFYYALGLCVLLWYLYEFTPVGRRLLFVGRGRVVARLSGLSVGRLRLGAFVAAAVISAFAGVLQVGTTGAADPVAGNQLLLPAFAAAFLGATTVTPGRFNPWGAFVAVYFLATGITGLQLLGVQSFVQQLFYGLALVVAVVLAHLVRRDRSEA